MARLPSTILAAALIALSGVTGADAAHHLARHHAAAHEAARRAPAITADSVNSATFNDGNAQDPSMLIKAEVLLDRHHFSPGQIDGENGDNFKKALSAFAQANNLPATGKMDSATWNALAANAPDKVLTSYTIANADLAGPFDQRIPANLAQMAALPGLSYKTPREELAEKFHMSETLLAKLNPGARFDRAGTQITVADVTPMALRNGQQTVEAAKPRNGERAAGTAATIVVDKPARNVRAYDKDGKLMAFYPATIGSTAKPAPTGTYKVRRVAWNPDYHYDPKFAWKGVKADRPLTVKPGPNNPVGLVWIDLSAPSYGIHGTPDPEKIAKSASHGCIRLTNWDAVDLARMARRGTVVRFDDQDSAVVPSSGAQARDNTAPPSSVGHKHD